ncbi:NUDIX domain-containing protein [Novosphingobium sp. G106]|uniref:NUDIX domain-containing protein n=1 Tax=Novosphingobium sp. G106 TaxID=2849500 RepID=UPI001C2D4214|nr:NUDIX domain-containing protein [Novosphingobium sp. G106]MBV1690807.1 NUDIX domain-containing protein [Novosphingobium sp. G106]
MLHLIPKPLHRLAYRLAHAVRRVWWRVARPRVSGCRVLAFDGEGRVLLVRHSYGSGNWMAPGGGLKRGEDPLLAGPRELVEETGCALEGVWRVALVEEPLKGATNVVHVLAGQAAGSPVPDGREVIEVAFFAPEALPLPMSDLLRRDLPGWLMLAKNHRSS